MKKILLIGAGMGGVATALRLTQLWTHPNLCKPHPQHKTNPNLLQNITGNYTNHIWGIDITYTRLQGGWMYLVAVID